MITIRENVHKGLQRRYGKVNGEQPKGLDGWG